MLIETLLQRTLYNILMLNTDLDLLLMQANLIETSVQLLTPSVKTLTLVMFQIH